MMLAVSSISTGLDSYKHKNLSLGASKKEICPLYVIYSGLPENWTALTAEPLSTQEASPGNSV